MAATSEYVPSGLTLPQASTVAAGVDNLYDFLFWISVGSFVITIGAAVFFIFKYRRTKKGHQTAYITGNHTLEIIWTAVPVVFLAVIFIWGWVDYLKMRTAEPDAVEINIVGRQWMWEATYASGKSEINALHVPKGVPVKLIMTSTDVIHSFFIPAFRIKQDVVPGMFTQLPLKATATGVYQIFCAEYCGTSHSKMLAAATVMEPDDFNRWVNGLPVRQASGEPPRAKEKLEPLAEAGAKLFQQKSCVTCHSTGDMTGKIGPTLRGVFGKEQTLADGRKVRVDENYLRESMMDPQAKVVAGYPGVMPTFRGLLKDDEVNAIISYIKSLK